MIKIDVFLQCVVGEEYHTNWPSSFVKDGSLPNPEFIKRGFIEDSLLVKPRQLKDKSDWEFIGKAPGFHKLQVCYIHQV